MTDEGLLIAKGRTELRLLPRLANRHGLIAGATGTGKTVTLQVMAENFSRIGVPVFMADVKGDLAGISRPGAAAGKVQERLVLLGLADYPFAGCPVMFWDVFGEQGHPVRTTVSDMGPLLLGRLLNLNEVQAGVLSVAFRAADDAGLLLLDFKDLRAMVQYVGDNPGEFETAYGRVSSASVGAIQRALLVLEDQGGDRLFGEPALDLEDFMQTDARGRGYVNILTANRLMLSPKMYATFLLWLLSELFERLPEIGDPDKPRLVFFFDEAHLLFEDAPPALMEKIEQVVRLIRSKGVGVFFITQNPIDIPDDILGQLGNRVQHALRAFTPRDQKAVRAMAETFRQNPAVDVETAVTQLAVGEGLISFLDEKGQPGIVERAWVLPPASRIGTITPQEREAVVRQSLVYGRYENATDRDSAYEMLRARAEARVTRPAPESRRDIPPDFSVGLPEPPMRGGGRASYPGYPSPAPRRPAGRRDTLFEAMAKSAARSVGSSLGRSVLRGVLGSILGGRR